MCDTFIAMQAATEAGIVLLAKNSDREPEEAQALLHVPRLSHPSSTLRCTYLEIPQVAETYECFLSKPYQMWGAEMGVNEWGVGIGNEAVFTKVKINKRSSGLTGMDLLRLALERTRSADEAVACITSLLERHGQDACGGYRNRNFYYHNSFIISDSRQAFVLDTAGREWAVEEIRDIRSISNRLSVANSDRLSEGAKANASKHRWWSATTPFHFDQVYSDWLYTRVGRSAARQSCTTEACQNKKGHLQVADCFEILQTHNLDIDQFKPSRATTGSVCMHATGFLNPSQTTGSMVAAIRAQQPHTVWLTGTSMPCLSVYIPFFFGTNTLAGTTAPSGVPDSSLWWRAEALHRWICQDYRHRREQLQGERMELQQQFISGEQRLISENAGKDELQLFSTACLEKTYSLIERWSQRAGL